MLKLYSVFGDADWPNFDKQILESDWSRAKVVKVVQSEGGKKGVIFNHSQVEPNQCFKGVYT